MASEHYKCKGELAITDIEEAEAKHNACFVDNHDIIREIIKEEATEFKPISEYVVSNECLKNGKFEDTNTSEFEIMLRDTVEDPTESKCSPAHFWINGNFNGLAGELSESKVKHFHNGVILKSEDLSECNDDSLTNNAEFETETIKMEDDIDVIYDDVKPDICEEKSCGKSENGLYSNVTDILIGTEIGPNFSHGLSKDFWKNGNFNGLGCELSESKVNHFNNAFILKSEDLSECNDDSLTNNAESKRKTIKMEDDIDVIYHDVKPDICEEKSREKSENGLFPNVTDILIGTEIGPNFSHGLSKDSETMPQQNKQEDESAVENDNNARNHHERALIGEKPFQCKICDKSFNRKWSLAIHMRLHTGEKPFQCKICSKSFRAKDSLLYHEKIHTGKKLFQCKICTKSFFEKRTLTSHERIHTGEKPFQCKICAKLFTQKRQLTIHERIHTGVKLFLCKICDKSFNRKWSLAIHMRHHTGEKPFQCKICSKSFRAKDSLSNHEKIHTGKKLFQCKICDESLNQKSVLTVHMRLHTGEKPFQCKICLKSFNQKGHLTSHERIHTSEKPFQCKNCSKSFKHKANLTMHERIHTGEKLFQCKICDKSFNRKSNLTVHMRLHTGEKPFQCNFCPDSFALKQTLVHHKRIHTGKSNSN